VSVNLPVHHKVQKFSSGLAYPGGPGKRAIKWLCVCVSTVPRDWLGSISKMTYFVSSET